MKPRLTLLFRTLPLPSLAIAMVLIACTPARNDMNTPMPAAETSQDREQNATPRRKLNPNRKRAYRITLTIDNGPGPFGSVEGVAQYDVHNENECGRINPDTGTAYRMPSLESFALEKVSDTEYQGTVYADLLLDEDYYGKGVCRWSFTSVEVQLKATGAEGETRFLPDMKNEQVLARQTVTKYFWKDNYPHVETYNNFPDYGSPDPAKIPSSRRGEFFTIALSATEAQP